MTKQSKDVQGFALYMEFRKPQSTVQVLITPDGFTNDTDGVTNAQFFRRNLTHGVTKRKWRAYPIRMVGGQKEALLHAIDMDSETVSKETLNRYLNLADYFDSLVRGGYKLVKDQPIYVEITKDDLVAARQGNLPTKLWARVKSCKTALGFPEQVTDTL